MVRLSFFATAAIAVAIAVAAAAALGVDFFTLCLRMVASSFTSHSRYLFFSPSSSRTSPCSPLN
jgi:hypothetical protein